MTDDIVTFRLLLPKKCKSFYVFKIINTLQILSEYFINFILQNVLYFKNINSSIISIILKFLKILNSNLSFIR